MRKLYFSVFLFLTVFAVNAQIINFTNTTLKHALVNTACTGNDIWTLNEDVDTNNDGEIEVSEALAVTVLNLDSNNLTSLEGIAHFTNLEWLSFAFNNIAAFDATPLPSLFQLHCGNNQLTSLVFNPNNPDDSSRPAVLRCENNLLTTLDLGNNLYDYLDCRNNLLTSVDTSEITGCYEAYFQNNQLTSLSLPLQLEFWGYGWLNISNNPLTEFSVAGFIEDFTCVNTSLTALDLSQSNFLRFVISGNNNLQYLNLKNGGYDACPLASEQSCDGPFLISNSQLQYICIDSDEEAQFIAETNISTQNALFSTYCTFLPGGQFNSFTGNIVYNNGSENVSATEVPVQIDNGVDNTVYSNADGEFFFTTILPTAVVTPGPGSYFNVTPNPATANFTDNNHQTMTFTLTPNGTHRDLEVIIQPLGPAIPGFDASYKIIYKNRGTHTESGSLLLEFDNDVIDFVSSTPSVVVEGSYASWNFTNLKPFESRETTITFNLNSPMETPPTNNGDVLNFTAIVASTGNDETPDNNAFALRHTIVNSFDPNDKTVAEGDFISPDQLDDYLHYTIRFQNLGTAPAQNVVIKDIINSNFDLSTLQTTGASHPYHATLTNDKLEFFLQNIQLPPASENEPASHGYVTFKIKPKDTVVLGNVLQNTAEIYFDFNWPIVTNTVTTTVGILKTETFEKNLFTVYPNPVSTLLNVKSDNKIDKVDVLNQLGQLILSSNGSRIDVSGWAPGLYFVKAYSRKTSATQKFIKS